MFCVLGEMPGCGMRRNFWQQPFTAAIPIPESQLLLRRRSFWHGLMGKVFWMYGSFWQEEKCRW